METHTTLETIDMSPVGATSGIPFLFGETRKHFIYDPYQPDEQRESRPVHIKVTAPTESAYICAASLFPSVNIREIMLDLARMGEVCVFCSKKQKGGLYSIVLSGYRLFSVNDEEMKFINNCSETIARPPKDVIHRVFHDRDLWLESCDVDGFEKRLIEITLSIVNDMLFRHLVFAGFSVDTARSTKVEMVGELCQP